MAQVKVFVDDAVLGQLPLVCAKGGTATDSRLRIVHEIGSPVPSLLWLLLLAGPVGWIALALLLPQSSGEQLTIEVPLSDERYERFTAARRRRNLTDAAGVVALCAVGLLIASAGIYPGGVLLLVLVAIGGLLAHVEAVQRFKRASVGVALDGSRRWVTLQRVHPKFADACVAQARSHQLADRT